MYTYTHTGVKPMYADIQARLPPSVRLGAQAVLAQPQAPTLTNP